MKTEILIKLNKTFVVIEGHIVNFMFSSRIHIIQGYMKV